MTSTELEKATSGEVAIPADDDGLEDFDTEDMVMPRLTIVHADGVFKDNLSGETWNEGNVILLGLVKQRVLWDPDPDASDAPYCKSYDHDTGHAAKGFPWKASSFNPNDFDDEDPTLPCNACPLKDWGSHPKNETPWCTEQFVLPLLTPIGENGWAPAIVTFQRSAVKAVKAYLTAFKRRSVPLYTVQTTMGLHLNKKGSVPYSVPYFTAGEETDPSQWPSWAAQFRTIREFIRSPRSRDPEEGGTAPAPKAEEKPAAKAEKPAAASVPADGDDVFDEDDDF